MLFKLKKFFKNKSANTKTLVTNILGAFFVKGLSLVISLLTIPAFISYFNDNTYLGIWYTVLSFVTWFLTFDLGIGNGIRNNLVTCFVKKDIQNARQIISSGLAISILFSVLIWVIGYTVIQYVDWNSLFNIDKKIVEPTILRDVMVLLFSAIAIRLALVSIGAIFYALQLSSINNLLALLSSIGIFVYIKLFHFSTPQQALIQIANAYILCYNLPLILAGLVIFITKLKYTLPSFRYISKSALRQVCVIGGIFFYCQILFTIITNSDQFVITKYFGAIFTVDYTFYYRLTSIIGMVVALCMTPLWSMITKAREENNMTWLRKLYIILKWIASGIIFLEFLFIPLLQPIMNIWLRDNTIEVYYPTAIAFAFYGALFIMNNIFATFACGLSMMRIQYIWYTIGLIFKIVFIILGKYYDFHWAIVIWSDVIALAPYIIFQILFLNKFFDVKLFSKKNVNI